MIDMHLRTFTLGLITACGFAAPVTAAPLTSFSAPLATPPGITLQVLGKGQGYDLGKQAAAALPRDQIAYADARGMTLYIHRTDPPGKSACVDACAKAWPTRPSALTGCN